MTGYIVRKKNLHYYKCSKDGCNCNKSAAKMHWLFLDVLTTYQIKEKLAPAIAHEYEAAFIRKNGEHFEQRQTAVKKLLEIAEAVERLDEKHYIREEMTRQKYDLLMAKLDKDKVEWTEILEKSAVVSSNLAEKLIQASQLCRNLPEIWKKGSYNTRAMLQKLLFPEGIRYDKKNDALLTPKINTVILKSPVYRAIWL